MIRKRVISATITLSVFQGLGRGLDLLGTLIVAKFIAPEAFGVVAAALIVLQLSQSLTELNINQALIQREEVSRADYDTAFTISLARGLLITILMCAVAYPLAINMGNTDIAPVVMCLSLAPLIQSLRSPKTAEYAREVRLMYPAAVDFAGRATGFVIMFVVAFLAQTYWAIVIGMVVGSSLAAIGSYVISPFRPALSLKEARWIFSFSGWLNLFTISNAGLGQFDRYFVGSRLGTEILGIYTVATSIASQLIWSLAAPIMNALFAGLSNLKRDPIRLKKAYLLAQNVIGGIMMPLGVGLALVSSEAIHLALGPEWMLAAAVVAIIAPSTALHMLTVSAHASALALGRTRTLFIRNAIALIANVPMVVIGTMYWGVVGASYARALTILIIVALNFQLGRELVGASYIEQFRNTRRTLLSCIVMIAMVLGLRHLVPGWENIDELLALILMIVVGAITYIGTHLALWILEKRPDGLEATVLDQLSAIISKGRAPG